jgi:hypothetical protein
MWRSVDNAVLKMFQDVSSAPCALPFPQLAMWIRVRDRRPRLLKISLDEIQ